jgi:hypothetical protein
MSLSAKQSTFAQNIAKLIQKIAASGDACTFGEVYRTQTQAWVNSLPSNSVLKAVTANGEVRYPNPVGGVGVLHSAHMQRLAVDLNLFRAGVLIGTLEDFRPYGEYWKSLDPLNHWGGDFQHPRPDPAHFSMEDGGLC